MPITLNSSLTVFTPVNSSSAMSTFNTSWLSLNSSGNTYFNYSDSAIGFDSFGMPFNPPARESDAAERLIAGVANGEGWLGWGFNTFVWNPLVKVMQWVDGSESHRQIDHNINPRQSREKKREIAKKSSTKIERYAEKKKDDFVNRSQNTTQTLVRTTYPAAFSLGDLDGTNGFKTLGGAAGSGASVSMGGSVTGQSNADVFIAGSSSTIYTVYGKNTPYSSTFNLGGLNGQNGFYTTRIGKIITSLEDINGDNVSDFAVGDHQRTISFMFGNRNGFSSPAYFSLNGQDGFELYTSAMGSTLGSALADAEDVNKDNFSDVLIGDPGRDQTLLLWGKSSFPATVYSYPNGLPAGYGVTFSGELGSATGSSVAGVGKFNGDDYPEVLIGAPDILAAGQAYLIFGGSTMPATIDLTKLDGNNGVIFIGLNGNDKTGLAIAGRGDINGDGLKDIAIAAPYAAVNGQYQCGKIFIVFGTTAKLANPFYLYSLNGKNGFVINGVVAYGHAGISVAFIKDINGDGYDELAIGADQVSANGYSAAGVVYIFLGGPNLPASFDLNMLDGSNGLVITGNVANARTGCSVSGDYDMNGDKVPDIIIGASGINNVYVVFGPVIAPIPSPSPTPQPSLMPLPSPTPKPSPTSDPSPTPKPSPTPDPSPTPKPSPTPDPSPTPKPSPTPDSSPTSKPSPTPDPSPTSKPSPTPDLSPTPQPSLMPVPSPSPLAIHSPSTAIMTMDWLTLLASPLSAVALHQLGLYWQRLGTEERQQRLGQALADPIIQNSFLILASSLVSTVIAEGSDEWNSALAALLVLAVGSGAGAIATMLERLSTYLSRYPRADLNINKLRQALMDIAANGVAVTVYELPQQFMGRRAAVTQLSIGVATASNTALRFFGGVPRRRVDEEAGLLVPVMRIEQHRLSIGEKIGVQTVSTMTALEVNTVFIYILSQQEWNLGLRIGVSAFIATLSSGLTACLIQRAYTMIFTPTVPAVVSHNIQYEEGGGEIPQVELPVDANPNPNPNPVLPLNVGGQNAREIGFRIIPYALEVDGNLEAIYLNYSNVLNNLGYTKATMDYLFQDKSLNEKAACLLSLMLFYLSPPPHAENSFAGQERALKRRQLRALFNEYAIEDGNGSRGLLLLVLRDAVRHRDFNENALFIAVQLHLPIMIFPIFIDERFRVDLQRKDRQGNTIFSVLTQPCVEHDEQVLLRQCDNLIAQYQRIQNNLREDENLFNDYVQRKRERMGIAQETIQVECFYAEEKELCNRILISTQCIGPIGDDKGKSKARDNREVIMDWNGKSYVLRNEDAQKLQERIPQDREAIPRNDPFSSAVVRIGGPRGLYIKTETIASRAAQHGLGSNMAMERAIWQLAVCLFGVGLVPVTDVVRISGAPVFDSELPDAINTIWQIATAVDGVSLSYIMQAEPAILNAVTPMHFSQQFFFALLTDPADAHSKNFKVRFTPGDDGGYENVAIVSVDNDKVFSSAAICVNNATHQGQSRLNIECVFYLLNNMDESIEIAQELVEKIYRPEIWLLEWINYLMQRDKYYHALLEQGLISSEELYREFHFPLLLNENTIRKLYEKLLKIRDILTNCDYEDVFAAGGRQGRRYHLNYDALLQEVEPFVGTAYGRIRHCFPSICERIDYLNDREEGTIEDLYPEGTGTEVLRRLEGYPERGYTDRYAYITNRSKTVGEELENWLPAIDFSTLTKDQQKLFLKELSQCYGIKRLVFRGLEVSAQELSACLNELIHKNNLLEEIRFLGCDRDKLPRQYLDTLWQQGITVYIDNEAVALPAQASNSSSMTRSGHEYDQYGFLGDRNQSLSDGRRVNAQLNTRLSPS